ncbi:hypothetical protein L6452_42423 [Arctium lappa]|uniref:Uncharacterized protein n=1 Tax=Arctium lappa TaxID=4217 RepID=A0ACB8XJE8_ARCLA|nr:hypothetical protein L6452_42423 [Arctium lappa]
MHRLGARIIWCLVFVPQRIPGSILRQWRSVSVLTCYAHICVYRARSWGDIVSTLQSNKATKVCVGFAWYALSCVDVARLWGMIIWANGNVRQFAHYAHILSLRLVGVLVMIAVVSSRACLWDDGVFMSRWSIMYTFSFGLGSRRCLNFFNIRRVWTRFWDVAHI